ncbi:hypothetical protein TK90_1051 [Thioalkalivibrio sp. K90mix]|uniref:hypothetical protein n=1 Tax=unclassified Thioalkalivibrio TaxID=2621013 RepID=UPI0001C4E230|nr:MULTISPECIES: hypothetical protein [unclassified Thioalkalivibrio]ADC71563.1 hypothetical protein TK90_1051 [Thioalkalivibrio sp. K90mix]
MPDTDLNAFNGTPRCLGIDVARAHVVIHDLHAGRTLSVENASDALHTALATCVGHDQVVCETTGGDERAVLDVAPDLNLPIHCADACRVKAFIAPHGGRADVKPVAFMAALSVALGYRDLSTSYKRLLARGKPKPVAPGCRCTQTGRHRPRQNP